MKFISGIAKIPEEIRTKAEALAEDGKTLSVLHP